uniref:Adipose-secreted signaling protein n=1 Tax=Laticauda laticaudata TaxID=8630 RepID=A0A8C5RVY4_LATLA
MAEESEDSDVGPGPLRSGLLPSEIVGAGSSDEEVPEEPVPSACASMGNWGVRLQGNGPSLKKIKARFEEAFFAEGKDALKLSLVDIIVGFLKIMHKYEITFVLPFVQVLGTNICPAPLSNLYLKVTDIAPVSEGYRVRCEYVAHKEGVLHEEMVLCSESNHSASIKVVVQARVMDRHHGTPMLLEGVKCIGAEVEYDSEQSEWQGFD